MRSDSFVIGLILFLISICSPKEARAMLQEGPIHHSMDYIEFTVTDLEKAKTFYAAAFDWKFNDYGPTYAGIQKENGEAGGFQLGTEVLGGGPLVVLYSKNLDETLERVRKAEGVIVKEPFAFPGGRRFHFRDPSGNELAVYCEK